MRAGFRPVRTTFEELKPGDLFYYPTRLGLSGASSVHPAASVQVRTDAPLSNDTHAADFQVIRLEPFLDPA